MNKSEEKAWRAVGRLAFENAMAQVELSKNQTQTLLHDFAESKFGNGWDFSLIATEQRETIWQFSFKAVLPGGAEKRVEGVVLNGQVYLKAD